VLQAEGPEDKKREILDLLEKRRDEVETERQALESLTEAGRVSKAALFALSSKVLEAELAVATSPAQTVKALQTHLDNMKAWEEFEKQRAAKGYPDYLYLTSANHLQVKVERLQAEIALATAKSKAAPPGK
jgi:hypothetical protein